MRALEEIFLAQRKKSLEGGLSAVTDRRDKLGQLKRSLLVHLPKLQSALAKDFRKPGPEVEYTEVLPLIKEIDFALKHLEDWVRPQRVPTIWQLLPARSEIHYRPKGVVLIISPWNYPIYLSLMPLVAAIAAGNRLILRVSEKVPHTNQVLAALLGAVFKDEEVFLVTGDASINERLLALPFDHFFFTGSTRVGRIVAAAAAKHLAGVTLELGGKSPVIVAADANLGKAAERVVFGKLMNAGQACVAPDYALVHESVAEQFEKGVVAQIKAMFGESAHEREQTPDFARLIDTAAYDRVVGLIEKSIEQGAKLSLGGVFRRDDRFVAPTVLTQVRMDHPIMAEEIFGPVLPILTYKDNRQLLELLQARPNPLALYIFSRSTSLPRDVLTSVRAGGVVINDVVIHLANSHLPFGGIGESGLGSYHGWHGFKTFSHEQAVLIQRPGSLISWLAPPYSGKRFEWAIRMFRA